MSLFPFFKRKHFFTAAQQKQIVDAIAASEKMTNGEIRVFVESHCRFVNPLDRAAQAFHHLKMDHTRQHNAVLVYIAMKDRQLAIFGDEGIHQKVGDSFWNEKVLAILSHFNKADYAGGIVRIVLEMGEALANYFPYDKDHPQNELPDDIVYGR